MSTAWQVFFFFKKSTLWSSIYSMIPCFGFLKSTYECHLVFCKKREKTYIILIMLYLLDWKNTH